VVCGRFILDCSLPDEMQVYGSNRRNENLVRRIRLLDSSPRARNLPVLCTLVGRSFEFATLTVKDGKPRSSRVCSYPLTLLQQTDTPSDHRSVSHETARSRALSATGDDWLSKLDSQESISKEEGDEDLFSEVSPMDEDDFDAGGSWSVCL
jgi:hypothetical protein